MPDDIEMKYRARDALNIIARAEEHKRDGALMKHVHALATTQLQAIKGTTDMKKMGKLNAGKDPKAGKIPVAKAQAAKDKGPSKIENGRGKK